MGDGAPKHPSNQHEGDCSPPCKGALESAEGYIAASASSGHKGHECGSQFSSSFGSLVDWGQTKGLVQPSSNFDFLKRKPDGKGREHEAWFDERTNRWFKSTYANCFGLAWGKTGTASPWQYLKRLLLQNRHFGDDVQLVALIEFDGKLRVLTSQPHIAGDPATREEIQAWFTKRGFIRIESESGIAWFNKESNLLIADAHEGNVIRSGGELVPIDLNIHEPSGEMLEWILNEIASRQQP